MDLSINKIHHILLDAALPSTIEDLKNPTEDYIVNLLKAFLSQFYIDVSLIYQVRLYINHLYINVYMLYMGYINYFLK